MLTGLELTFMGLTQSASGLFSTPGIIVSPVGKRERGDEKKIEEEKKIRERGKMGIEKERKEGSRNKERSEAV